MKIRRLGVIGLGLIGGSLARALRAAEAVESIVGFDADPEQVQTALKLGVIDSAAASAPEAVLDADVLVLAVPVLQTAPALRACGAIGKSTVVTDVGSTKKSVLGDVAAMNGGRVPENFVAAHPIAGTEHSGVANALTDLFRGHRVILTPHEEISDHARATVTWMWQQAGARVVEMDPAKHDLIFAATSHLPHVLAYSFVDLLDRLDSDGEIFPNAGGGFRDFTRIASSNPDMWHDILRANSGTVIGLLEQQVGALRQVLEMMRANEWDALRAMFERARSARQRHLARIE